MIVSRGQELCGEICAHDELVFCTLEVSHEGKHWADYEEMQRIISQGFTVYDDEPVSTAMSMVNRYGSY